MSDGAPLARRWVAQGRVQGVGFRWFVLQRARTYGVAGWVLNRDDGSVEVIAAGSHDALGALEKDLRRGPPGAYVTALDAQDVPHEAVDTKSFNIKR